MSEPELDDSIRAFLETHLDSFEKLEIMQALHTAKRPMSPKELGAACQLGSDLLKHTLAGLEHAQLIMRERVRWIRPGRGCSDPRFAVLMRHYADDRAGILGALSSVAVQRIRSMVVTAFADVFARKKQGNDG